MHLLLSGVYIDQSQSLNLFLKAPTFAQLSSMHFHGWRRGLKTGMYYLRTQPATDVIKLTTGAIGEGGEGSESAQAVGDNGAASPGSSERICEMCSG